MSHRITVAEELRTDADLIAIRAAASHVVSVVDPVTSTLTGTLTTGHLTAVDCTAGPATYTLPSAASAGKGGVVVVKKNDTTVNTIAIQRAGSDVIQGTGAGSTSRSVTLAGEAVTLVSNGTNSWSVTSSDVPIGQLDSRYNGTYASKVDLPVNVKNYGAKGDGTTDDTVAITAAYAANPFVFFPAGNYIYNGTGIDLAVCSAVGVRGGGSKITLGSTSFFFRRTAQQTTLIIRDLTFSNGLGAYCSTYTGGNVYDGEFVVADCFFKNFTQCAIGHNASDWPNWKIQRSFFTGNSYNAICIALPGLSDNNMVNDLGFGGTYLTAVKLGRGGNNAKLVNLDLTSGTNGTTGNIPACPIWIVPSPSNTNAGSGLVIDKVKFGNEHLNPGVDYRIVYADEDTGTGADFTTHPPKLTTASTGFISGHRVLDCQIAGSSGAGNSIVYSTTPNVQGCYYGPLTVSGAPPSYILEFAAAISPLPPSRLNSRNLAGPLLVQNEDASGSFAWCSENGVLLTVDPIGAFQAGKAASPFYGSGLATSGVTILSDALASTFTAVGGTVAVSGTTDALGGNDAIQAVFGTGAVNLPSISSSLIKTDRPLWIEFDLLNDTSLPVTDLALTLLESATQQHRLNVMVAPASSGWLRYKFQTGLRSAASNLTASFGIGLSGGAGTVSIGRVRLYHAREPVPLDIAHRGHYAGFFGAVPVARPTVTGARADATALASLLTQLASLGLIADTSTAGSFPSAPDETALFGGMALTTGEETIDRRWVTTNSFALTSGKQSLVFFRARKTETITQVRVFSGSTASTGLTHAIVSVYSLDSSGNGTLIASTADDTTMFAATNTAYTRSFTSSFTKTAGTRYAVSILASGSPMPTLPICNLFNGSNTGEVSQDPRLAGGLGSGAAAPASSFTAGSVSGQSSAMYAVLLP